jgi:hypothetical protein
MMKYGSARCAEPLAYLRYPRPNVNGSLPDLDIHNSGSPVEVLGGPAVADGLRYEHIALYQSGQCANLIVSR